MKTMRPLAATLLVPTLLLAACGGGDDDKGDKSDGPTTAAVEPTREIETGIPAPVGDPCDAEVTLAGAIEKSFSEEGAVALDNGDGPLAVYQVTDGETVVTAYAAGNGFQPSVIINNGTKSYGTSNGARGLDIADDGSGATIDTVAMVPGGGKARVQVTATFSC